MLVERYKTIEKLRAILDVADKHSDDDDFFDRRLPTPAELQNALTEMLNSADNRSSLDVNVMRALQQTQLIFN